MKYFFFTLIVLSVTSCMEPNCYSEPHVKSTNQYVNDEKRDRAIPTQIYALSDSTKWNGELVILNCGYGSSPTEYTYIAQELAQTGYYVVSVQHEIQGDELIPSGDDIIKLRTPNWEKGIKNMNEVLKFVKQNVPTISTQKIHLIGHSNGGDISVLFASRNPNRVHSLITLDHRRMPIPLTKKYPTLSFRADQFEADPGVIPSKSDQKVYRIEIVSLKNVEHNYLRDIASQETKKKVIHKILEFLS